MKFYECKECGSSYTKEIFKPLYDRWLMPITLPLYGVIYEENPVLKAMFEAESFAERKDMDLSVLLFQIRQELKEPTQKISNIHNFEYPNEKNLRKFLECFADELERLLSNA